MAQIELTRADGTVTEAEVTLEDVWTDPDLGAWRNATVTVDGRSFRVGGGNVHTEESARAHNRSEGLQIDEYPEMHWPGAARAGRFVAYDLSAKIRDGVAGPANYDECGEIEALVRHLGHALDAPQAEAAWNGVAKAIRREVVRFPFGEGSVMIPASPGGGGCSPQNK